MSSTRQNSSYPVQPPAEESHANLAKVRTQLFLDEAPRDGNTLAVLHQSARSQSQVRKHTSKKLERIMSPFSQ